MSSLNRWRFLPSAGVCAVYLFTLLTIVWVPSPMKASDDWLKVEEEKPLFEEDKPKAAPAPAPGGDASQADLQKEADAMKRYLKRFRDALAEASRVLDRREALIRDLEARSKAFSVLQKKFDAKAKEMVDKAWKELKKYDPLVKNDPRFKFLDPGQDPDFKKRGDEIIENGGKMCRMAQKWAKSKKKQERDKLKADLENMRDETKRKQDRLKTDFQAMVTAMKPIYRALADAQKRMTPQEKQKLIAMYGQIISAVLENQPVDKAISRTSKPYLDQLQKARDASKMVLHYLNNHPKLPGVPNPKAIREEVNTGRAVKPLEDRAGRLSEQRKACANFFGLYQQLEDGPGIAAVKLARATNNWVAAYSSSKDIYSRATNNMVDIMYRSKVATDDIKERKRLLDREWQRSRDSLRNDGKCVKKWMSKKPARYFRGALRQSFSAKVIRAKAGGKCSAKSAQCQNVSAEVEAVTDPENQKIRILAKKVPNLYINYKSARGMYCQGQKGEYRLSYTLKYDPASGSAVLKGKNQGIKGRVSGSGFVFEEVRTFQNSRGGCGVVEYLVQTRGKLNEAAFADKSRGLDLEAESALDEIPSLDTGEEGIGSAP